MSTLALLLASAALGNALQLRPRDDGSVTESDYDLTKSSQGASPRSRKSSQGASPRSKAEDDWQVAGPTKSPLLSSGYSTTVSQAASTRSSANASDGGINALKKGVQELLFHVQCKRDHDSFKTAAKAKQAGHAEACVKSCTTPRDSNKLKDCSTYLNDDAKQKIESMKTYLSQVEWSQLAGEKNDVRERFDQMKRAIAACDTDTKKQLLKQFDRFQDEDFLKGKGKFLSLDNTMNWVKTISDSIDEFDINKDLLSGENESKWEMLQERTETVHKLIGKSISLHSDGGALRKFAQLGVYDSLEKLVMAASDRFTTTCVPEILEKLDTQRIELCDLKSNNWIGDKTKSFMAKVQALLQKSITHLQQTSVRNNMKLGQKNSDLAVEFFRSDLSFKFKKVKDAINAWKDTITCNTKFTSAGDKDCFVLAITTSKWQPGGAGNIHGLWYQDEDNVAENTDELDLQKAMDIVKNVVNDKWAKRRNYDNLKYGTNNRGRQLIAPKPFAERNQYIKEDEYALRQYAMMDHEWIKHGKKSNLDLRTYFTRAYDLYQKKKVLSVNKQQWLLDNEWVGKNNQSWDEYCFKEVEGTNKKKSWRIVRCIYR
jgi:hypothetical protein